MYGHKKLLFKKINKKDIIQKEDKILIYVVEVFNKEYYVIFMMWTKWNI